MIRIGLISLWLSYWHEISKPARLRRDFNHYAARKWVVAKAGHPWYVAKWPVEQDLEKIAWRTGVVFTKTEGGELMIISGREDISTHQGLRPNVETYLLKIRHLFQDAAIRAAEKPAVRPVETESVIQLRDALKTA